MNKKYLSVVILQLLFAASAFAQYPKMDKLLYGVAYYDEYMPYERLDKDVQMMKAAGINVVRIAESTWGTVEPQDGVFDFTHIDRVLAAMQKGGIKVIVGTPTYAIPTWMARKHPEILAITSSGQNQYGPRQNMDITNADFRMYAGRVIRKIMEHVKDNPAVIGYQVDNETKAYGTSGPNVQALFVKYMQAKYKTLDNLNAVYGLNYWSNRINTWEDFPAVTGSTINASLSSEFAKFQRLLVTQYLAWQAGIVREYKRHDQFITQNFDLEWHGYSFGIQPDVDHFAASKAMDIAGIDIYHPSQDHLTGAEISFGGDVTRSMKAGKNYLVIETEAQGFPQWVPYPGQLRLQAFSHLASGANGVGYWPWHSIHNSFETYWKGLLSHDFEPNPVYDEAKTIGKDFDRLSPKLINLKKKNDVAILFSNEALTGFKAFGFGWGVRTGYNDVLRQLYDGLYHMNVGCDFVDPTSKNIEDYKLLVVPLLYAAPDSLLQRLNRYVKNGGHIIYTVKSGFADENVKVRTTHQPGIIDEACGIYYSQFTSPENVGLKGDSFDLKPEDKKLNTWMELITPTTAKVLAYYDHPVWGKYAAITENSYGKGLATYIGCLTTDAVTDKILADAVKKVGLWGKDQQLAFPLITKYGINQAGKTVHYYFNYSAKEASFSYPYGNGKELFSGSAVNSNATMELEPWGMKIIEVN
jgi:beta-galactosidase